MASKITKMDIINSMLADKNIVANATYKEYLENEKTILINKKARRKSATTKKQTENEELMTTIIDTMEMLNVGATVTEIQSANDILKVLSNQKVSSLMRILIDRGLVEKTTSKGKSLFSLVAEEEEDTEDVE